MHNTCDQGRGKAKQGKLRVSHQAIYDIWARDIWARAHLGARHLGAKYVLAHFQQSFSTSSKKKFLVLVF